MAQISRSFDAPILSKKLAFAIATFLLFVISCKKDDPFIYECHDGIVNFELFDNNLNPQAYLKEDPITKVGYVIIQDKNEMYEKIQITFLRNDIDFKNRSLIIVSITGGAQVFVESQHIEADCDDKKLNISADLKYSSQPIERTSYIFAVVPKIPSETKINFIPNYIN